MKKCIRITSIRAPEEPIASLTNGFERGMKRRHAGMKGNRAMQHMNFRRKYAERKPARCGNYVFY